jgi:phosphoserine aminotransferase
MKWLEETIGGLEQMEVINREKAGLLYDFLDSSEYYRTTAEPGSRSLMNITFRLPDENLEKKFVEEASGKGFGGLKGHISVGGCRASIYNATTPDAVKALIDFMKDFESKNG